MAYYDNATLMARRLGRWQDPERSYRRRRGEDGRNDARREQVHLYNILWF